MHELVIAIQWLSEKWQLTIKQQAFPFSLLARYELLTHVLTLLIWILFGYVGYGASMVQKYWCLISMVLGVEFQALHISRTDTDLVCNNVMGVGETIFLVDRLKVGVQQSDFTE